jgi:hypothetical protein
VQIRLPGRVRFRGRAITIECRPGDAPGTEVPLPPNQPAWTALTTIAVPANATIEHAAGRVSGTFRARISTPITGGTVTVTAVRPEEQRGFSRRPS